MDDPALAAAMAAAGPLGSIEAGKVAVDPEKLKAEPVPTPPQPAIDPDAIIAAFRAIVAQMTPGFWTNYVVPTSAVAGALGTFVCVCWLTLLTLGGGVLPPGPTPPVPAPPPPDIAFVQDSYTVEAGEPVDLEVLTKAGKVKYIWPDGLRHRSQGDKAAVAWSIKEGTYKVGVYAALAKDNATDVAWTAVVVGKPVPPSPPGPSDPFFVTLKAAYDQETAADKASQAAQLAALYQQAAATTVNDQSIKTTGDFLARFHAAVVSLMGDKPNGQLIKVRTAIGAELAKTLPVNPAQAMDGPTRQIITTEYNRMANDLGGLK